MGGNFKTGSVKKFAKRGKYEGKYSKSREENYKLKFTQDPRESRKRVRHKGPDLVFDEEKIKDFVGGFQKRKAARRKAGAILNAEKAAEERRQRRKEMRDSIQQALPVPPPNAAAEEEEEPTEKKRSVLGSFSESEDSEDENENESGGEEGKNSVNYEDDSAVVIVQVKTGDEVLDTAEAALAGFISSDSEEEEDEPPVKRRMTIEQATKKALKGVDKKKSGPSKTKRRKDKKRIQKKFGVTSKNTNKSNAKARRARKGN